MGRETKLLLGLLATLLGVFLGVLSMKLLVPRPPAGAGPDIDTDVVASEPHELVEPPRFDEPHLTPAAATTDRFAARPAPDAAPLEPRPVAQDPFVTRSSYARAETAVDGLMPPPDELAPPLATPRPVPAEAHPPTAVTTTPAAPPPVAGTTYVARNGDSWWSLAETVYGDGRLYRALFAWNRVVDPRVSLVPGTPLELPTRDRLQTAWPALVPSP